jgi:hypothetical protein
MFEWVALNSLTARPIPGTQAQNVIFTALLEAHEPPATTVTDELGEGEADVEVLPAAVEVLLLLPLLHAAIPVTAAIAVIQAAAMPRRLLAACPVLLVLLATMG